MKLLTVEPRKVQLLYLITENGRTLLRGSTASAKDLKELIVSYGVPHDNILVIITEHLPIVSQVLRQAIGAKSIRLSPAWATGTSFGYPSPDTYINSQGFDGGDLRAWVAGEYYQWLLGEKKRQRSER